MGRLANIPRLSDLLSTAVYRWRSLLGVLRGHFVRLLDRDETYRTYWALFGGWQSIYRSKYPYLAALITAICSPYWLKESPDAVRAWAQTTIDVVPSIMGFTLGGMAILLAFSNERFLRAIRASGEPNSLFMQGVAAFFHFLLIQSIAMVMALVVFAHPTDLLSGIGFFFLAYGLLSALAVAGMLMQISRVFNATGSFKDDDAA